MQLYKMLLVFLLIAFQPLQPEVGLNYLAQPPSNDYCRPSRTAILFMRVVLHNQYIE